ncbi:PHP domain-containing protein [soil metagenome]
MILADLHVHSTFSDGKMTISELVDFYGTRGFGCIAVTDHICEQKSVLGFAAGALKFTLSRETFPKYLEMIHSEAERAWSMYRLRVIPGFELSKNSWSNQRSAHVLGLGVSKWMPAELDILEMTKGLREQGALSIAAHPVHTGLFEPQTLHLWSRREELRFEFDAWEVASGRKFFGEVYASGLPMIASSDLHHARQISAWKTLLKVRADERSIEAVLDAVREQKLEFGFWNDASRQIQNIRTIESPTATRQPVMVTVG